MGVKTTCNIDEIMDMLDWNKPQEIQKKGREMAQNIKCFQVFIQPKFTHYNKNVWDNCALIIADRTDEELRPYLSELFEWLEDMNWPGAFCIWDRLKQFKNSEWFDFVLNNCIYKAKALKRRMWLKNLCEFQGEDILSQCDSLTINEAFSRRVYEFLVEASTNRSRQSYDDATIYEGMPEFGRKKIQLYQSFNESQKEVFVSILKETKIDTLERLFMMLEGFDSVCNRQDFEIEFKINGVATNDELTDTFRKIIRERMKCSNR